MALLYGMGRFVIETVGLTPNILVPAEPVTFSMNVDSEDQESLKWKDGIKVAAGAATTKVTYTLQFNVQAATWFVMQLATGELAQTTASASLKDVKYGTVPLTAPYEIADEALTTQNVLVSITTSGAWGKARPLTLTAAEATAPATANEVQVKTSAPKKLVFDATAAGAPIAYRVLNTYTSLSSIGVEASAVTLSAFGFAGIAYGDEEKYRIDVPRMVNIGRPTIEVNDVTELEFNYKLITTGADRLPFKMYDITGVVLP